MAARSARRAIFRRPLRPRRRQLVGDHPPPQEAELVHLRLCAGGGDLSVPGRRAALFRQGDPARRADADRPRPSGRCRSRCPSSSAATPRSPNTSRWSSGSAASATGSRRSRPSGRRRSRSRSSAAAPGVEVAGLDLACRTATCCARTSRWRRGRARRCWSPGRRGRARARCCARSPVSGRSAAAASGSARGAPVPAAAALSAAGHARRRARLPGPRRGA